MIIYVNAAAGHDGNGTKEMPFRRINDAAHRAQPGDEILVSPGIYRENVDPVNSGREDARITYRSLEPLKAEITGAEEVKAWEPYRGDVYVTITTPIQRMFSATGILPGVAGIPDVSG